MTEKYLETKPPQQHPDNQEFQGRKVEKTPSLMDQYIPKPEPRRVSAPSTTLRGARRGVVITCRENGQISPPGGGVVLTVRKHHIRHARKQLNAVVTDDFLKLVFGVRLCKKIMI